VFNAPRIKQQTWNRYAYVRNNPLALVATFNSDGSVTVDATTAALNGFADIPLSGLFGDPTASIDLSIQVTINSDGSANVDAGSTFSGYPSLEVWNYQDGEDPALFDYVPAKDIPQLGTNDTLIPPGNSDNPVGTDSGGTAPDSGDAGDNDDGWNPFDQF